MNTFSFSEKAVQDINSICDFYGKTNVSFASKLFDKIRKKCKLYADFPNMGKMDSRFLTNLTKEQHQFFSQLRSFRVEDYIIFYLPRQDGIDVYRIIYGKQDWISIFDELGYEQ
jgi:toxin ParE1/3/4